MTRLRKMMRMIQKGRDAGDNSKDNAPAALEHKRQLTSFESKAQVAQKNDPIE
jgi:hypothetical protein